MKDKLVILFPAVPKGAFQHIPHNLREQMVDVLQQAKVMLAQDKETYLCFALLRVEEAYSKQPLTVAACLCAREFIEQSLGHYSTLASWMLCYSLGGGRFGMADRLRYASASRPVWIDAIVKELKEGLA